MDDIQQLLPVGTILQGRYRVDQQLASGGFGKTYAVTNIRFDERWAMKEFFMKGISERDGDTSAVSVATASKPQFEAQREKFNKEARRLRRLHHLGIVHVEDLFDENGTSYYIMDYIGGGSLAETVKRHGPLSEWRIRQLLPQLLNALECVHNQNIWHLDLKPGNILLKDNGQPVLIDFGASKQMSLGGANSTSTGMTFTQGYAPSEQIDQNQDRIGPWTDIYALGATLYNLLTGNTPPLVSEIQDSDTEAFHFPNGISEQMRQLILWMMSPSRRRRPQSVDEVRKFLTLKKTEDNADAADYDDGDITQIPNLIPPHVSTPSPVSTPSAPTSFPNTGTKKNVRWFLIGLAALLAVITAVVLLPSRHGNSEEDEVDTVETVANEILPKTVTDLAVVSPIGNYSYSGPVDDEGKAHGTGVAVFADGRSYEGPFVHGTMQGTDATFTMNNGDVFYGELRDNRFYNGSYTIKEDGIRFQGSFKNGQPDQGSWYDKNGRRL